MRTVPLLFFGFILIAAPARAQDSALIAQGQKVYAAQKCGACHSIAGKGNKKGALDEVGTKLTADEVRQWLLSAPEMTKKTKATRKPAMKTYAKLPTKEIDALAAYMRSLKKK